MTDGIIELLNEMDEELALDEVPSDPVDVDVDGGGESVAPEAEPTVDASLVALAAVGLVGTEGEAAVDPGWKGLRVRP